MSHEQKRDLLLGLLIMCAGVIAFAVTSGAVHAQEAQRAYLVADPVRPDSFGLATLGGRYSISQSDGCAELGLAEGMNVWLAPVDGWATLAVIKPVERETAWCDVRLERLESSVPCFTAEDGQCDAKAEAA